MHLFSNPPMFMRYTVKEVQQITDRKVEGTKKSIKLLNFDEYFYYVNRFWCKYTELVLSRLRLWHVAEKALRKLVSGYFFTLRNWLNPNNVGFFKTQYRYFIITVRTSGSLCHIRPGLHYTALKREKRRVHCLLTSQQCVSQIKKQYKAKDATRHHTAAQDSAACAAHRAVNNSTNCWTNSIMTHFPRNVFLPKSCRKSAHSPILTLQAKATIKGAIKMIQVLIHKAHREAVRGDGWVSQRWISSLKIFKTNLHF